MQRRIAAAATVLSLAAAMSASSAGAAPVFDVFATATQNKTGSAKKPAPFAGGWGYTVKDGTKRPPTGFGSTFSFEGVTWNGSGMPTCSAQKIDKAQSDAGCPKGALILTTTRLLALVGPESNLNSSFACKGKTLHVWNEGANKAAAIVVGPGDQCAGLVYAPPYEWTFKTKSGTTTVTAKLPETVVHPLPGLGSTGNEATYKFINHKLTVGKRTRYYYSSTKCSGQRDFNVSILDAGGSHPFHRTLGKCSK